MVKQEIYEKITAIDFFSLRYGRVGLFGAKRHLAMRYDSRAAAGGKKGLSGCLSPVRVFV
jgi:hypothetical protein